MMIDNIILNYKRRIKTATATAGLQYLWRRAKFVKHFPFTFIVLSNSSILNIFAFYKSSRFRNKEVMV